MIDPKNCKSIDSGVLNIFREGDVVMWRWCKRKGSEREAQKWQRSWPYLVGKVAGMSMALLATVEISTTSTSHGLVMAAKQNADYIRENCRP
jgi:hypothetical protein